MNRTIGIDFGTTNTLVSRYDLEKREPKLIRLGKEMDKIPTSIYIDEKGNFLCGEDAEDQMQYSPDFTRYSSGRDFKLKLGESSPCMSVDINGKMKSFSALDLTTEFLKYIKKRCEEEAFMGEPVSDAVITEPVSFSAAQSRDLKKAAQDAGFTTVTSLCESEAAGLAFAELKPTEKFNRMMIVDWGGGTVDFAMISKDSDGEIHSNPNAIGGDNSLGGEIIDDILREHLTKKIARSDQKKRNPEDEPAEFKNRMIKEIRRCKEHLSKKSEIKLALPSEKESYRTNVSRDEFNDLITDKINDVVEKLNTLLKNKKIGQEPDALLMIGGTSNIPVIQKTLEKIKLDEKRTLECKHWEHANDAVALGSALYSMRSMHSSDHHSENITCPVCYQEIFISYPAGNEKIHCPQCKYEFMIQPASVPTVQEILKNPSQLDEVEKAAESGNSDAQFLLGSLYCDGIIVDCDPDKGFDWCEKAAASGNIFAKFYLAKSYYEGDGVKKDTEEAEKIIDEILPILEIGASHGNPFLQYAYGYLAHHGIHFSENRKIASDWYSLAAGNNNLNAILALVEYYCDESNDEFDSKKSFYWLQKASSLLNHDPLIIHLLSLWYLSGYGTEQNIEKGLELLKKSVQLGNIDAMVDLGQFELSKGLEEPDDQSLSSAVAHFKQASGQTNIKGMIWLAYCYFWGLGVTKDESKAEEYLSRAYKIDKTETEAYLDQTIDFLKQEGILKKDEGPLKYTAPIYTAPSSENMNGVAVKVKKIVIKQLAVPEDQVTEDARFIEDLNADSLDQVELIMALEEEFGSDIPDEDAEKLKTVGDVIKYVESHCYSFRTPPPWVM